MCMVKLNGMEGKCSWFEKKTNNTHQENQIIKESITSSRQYQSQVIFRPSMTGFLFAFSFLKTETLSLTIYERHLLNHNIFHFPLLR